MYKVQIRKFFRHADGSRVLYEDPGQVNHQRHAQNLAVKIARDPGVEWVEITEIRGRFKARASLGRDGTVHESLEFGRSSTGRKGKFSRRKRRNPQYQWIILAILFFFGLLALLIKGK